MINIMIIVFVLLIVCAVFVAFWLSISNDRKMMKLYKSAETCTGVIIRRREDYRLNAYGSGVLGMRKRVYSQYDVEFYPNGYITEGVYQTKEKNLNPGDTVTVHYILHPQTGKPYIVSKIYGDRLKELILGAILGVLLSAAIIFYKITA